VETFAYQARNTEGMLVVGDMEAEARESVVRTLKDRGYYLLSVERRGRLWNVMQLAGQVGRPVSVRDMALFTHQLATLLRAGMHLSVALATLAKQSDNAYLASVIAQLNTDIEQSSSLSEAMKRHPRVFSAPTSSIVGAAEQSGQLAETLTVLSKQLKTQAAVQARIRGAMAYPLFLLFTSAVIVGVLTTFVVPKFIQLFVNSNQALPWPTWVLHTITVGVRKGWWLILGGVALAAGLLLAAMRQMHFKESVHRLLLTLPGLGPLNQKLQLARFARTLGSLLDGGVQIIPAIHTTQGVTDNLAFAIGISGIEEEVLKGSSLATAMRRQPHFTEIAVNMTAVGEESGMLPEMLLELADLYDQECESTIQSLTTLLGPILIVLLGAIVGFVVIAILLPVFETSSMIG